MLVWAIFAAHVKMKLLWIFFFIFLLIFLDQSWLYRRNGSGVLCLFTRKVIVHWSKKITGQSHEILEHTHKFLAFYSILFGVKTVLISLEIWHSTFYTFITSIVQPAQWWWCSALWWTWTKKGHTWTDGKLFSKGGKSWVEQAYFPILIALKALKTHSRYHLLRRVEGESKSRAGYL